MSDFAGTIASAYTVDGPAVDLGRGVHNGTLAPEAVVQVPLRMMNRHGLVAGATGTGKTITLQVLAEQLSAAGVAVFAADVKGDVSGLSAPGESGGPAEKRMEELGLPFAPTGFPVEYLSLGGIGPGVPVRATVSDFGPQLLAKILSANETQEQSLALVFRYADEKGLPLLDLADLRTLLTFLESDAGKDELEGIGGVAKGVPTPVVHTRLRAPASRMGPADDVAAAAQASPLFAKYAERAEAESAHELLAARMEQAEPAAAEAAPKRRPKARKRPPKAQPAAAGGAEALGKFLTSREGKALQKKVTRGLFGMLRKQL